MFLLREGKREGGRLGAGGERTRGREGGGRDGWRREERGREDEREGRHARHIKRLGAGEERRRGRGHRHALYIRGASHLVAGCVMTSTGGYTDCCITKAGKYSDCEAPSPPPPLVHLVSSDMPSR